MCGGGCIADENPAKSTPSLQNTRNFRLVESLKSRLLNDVLLNVRLSWLVIGKDAISADAKI